MGTRTKIIKFKNIQDFRHLCEPWIQVLWMCRPIQHFYVIVVEQLWMCEMMVDLVKANPDPPANTHLVSRINLVSI